jgi:Tol biopolymer transport system component
MSNDEPMDEQLRRFLDWQAGQLDGTPDAHEVALRIWSRSGARSAGRARLIWAVVALALVAALVAAAALIGARLVDRPPIAGQLVYAMNDDIYLADQDGANPRKVTAGAPWANDASGGPSYVLGDGGPAWAPDGHHFLFFDVRGSAGQNTGHIADASGHVVGSIPNIWVDATWSPDSTRIEAWTGGSAWIGTTEISIYGTDGALQESLPLPDGYVRHRESPGFWAPDGRSVYVSLGQGTYGGSTSNLWQLPVDGSTPRHPPADDPLTSADSRFTHDGRRVAYVTDQIPPTTVSTLSVANADGNDRHVLAEGLLSGNSTPDSADPGGAIWSPDETHLAYAWVRAAYVDPVTTFDSDLRIVDVATGDTRTIVADLPYDITPIGWSPAGDKILFSTSDNAGAGSLWTVNVDGTHRTLVVAGVESGYWQPAPSSP